MQRKQNVGPLERGLRVVGGGLAVVIGLGLLLAGAASLVWVGAAIALVLLGLDFVVTGITGYCPLYHRLGWSTAPPRPNST